jgi:hypothetical protein
LYIQHSLSTFLLIISRRHRLSIPDIHHTMLTALKVRVTDTSQCARCFLFGCSHYAHLSNRRTPRGEGPAEIVLLCLRWALRSPLSERTLEEIILEREHTVDHTTMFRFSAHGGTSGGEFVMERRLDTVPAVRLRRSNSDAENAQVGACARSSVGSCSRSAQRLQ